MNAPVIVILDKRFIELVHAHLVGRKAFTVDDLADAFHDAALGRMPKAPEPDLFGEQT